MHLSQLLQCPKPKGDALRGGLPSRYALGTRQRVMPQGTKDRMGCHEGASRVASSALLAVSPWGQGIPLRPSPRTIPHVAQNWAKALAYGVPQSQVECPLKGVPPVRAFAFLPPPVIQKCCVAVGGSPCPVSF
jgi:hypothetical protein